MYVTNYTLYRTGGILEIPDSYYDKSMKNINNVIKKYMSERNPLIASKEKEFLSKIISVNDILINEKPEKIKMMVVSQEEINRRKTRLIVLPSDLVYHSNPECIRLNSNYKNFAIPVEIPYERIEEFRAFFLSNKKLFDNNKQIFYARAEIKFNIRINNVKEINGYNSGHKQVEMDGLLMMDDNKTKNEIDNGLFFFETYRKTIRAYSALRKDVIDRFMFECKISKDDYNIIRKWWGIKSNIKNTILEEMMKINKKENGGYSKDILESIGYSPCLSCKKESD